MIDLFQKTIEVPLFALFVSIAFLLIIILVEAFIIKDLSETKPTKKKPIARQIKSGFLGKPIYSMSILAILAIFALGSAITYNNQSLTNKKQADQEIRLEMEVESEKVDNNTYKTVISVYPYSNDILFSAPPYKLVWSIDGNQESTKIINNYSDSSIFLFISGEDHTIDITVTDNNNKEFSTTYIVNPINYQE